MRDYARGPGVRLLEQNIAKLCRKAAFEKVQYPRRQKKFSPTELELENYLGSAKFVSEMAAKSLPPGVVTGLAWTSLGGEILTIETLPLKGKGTFKLTGQLGEVMNESANIAYSFVRQILQREMEGYRGKLRLSKLVREGKIIEKERKNGESRGKKKVRTDLNMRDDLRHNMGEGPLERDENEADDFLSQHEIHLHLPAGATPKDGPSAGIAMALALYGLATNKKVRNRLAMTGELSLTGKVLPVGGIKEKVLGAKRAGIKEIIIPKENAKDLKEVPLQHQKGLKFYYVDNFREVLEVALRTRQSRTQ